MNRNYVLFYTIDFETKYKFFDYIEDIRDFIFSFKKIEFRIFQGLSFVE